MDTPPTGSAPQTIVIVLTRTETYREEATIREGHDVPRTVEVAVPIVDFHPDIRRRMLNHSGNYLDAMDRVFSERSLSFPALTASDDREGFGWDGSASQLSARILCDTPAPTPADAVLAVQQAVQRVGAKCQQFLAEEPAREAKRLETERRDAESAARLKASEEAEKAAQAERAKARSDALRRLVQPLLTEEQRSRCEAGFMDENEMLARISDSMFNLGPAFAEYEKMQVEDIAALCDDERYPDDTPDVSWSCEAATSLTDGEFGQLTALKAAFERYPHPVSFIVQSHVGEWNCGNDDHPLHRKAQAGCLVRIELAPGLTISREYQL